MLPSDELFSGDVYVLNQYFFALMTHSEHSKL